MTSVLASFRGSVPRVDCEPRPRAIPGRPTLTAPRPHPKPLVNHSTHCLFTPLPPDAPLGGGVELLPTASAEGTALPGPAHDRLAQHQHHRSPAPHSLHHGPAGVAAAGCKRVLHEPATKVPAADVEWMVGAHDRHDGGASRKRHKTTAGLVGATDAADMLDFVAGSTDELDFDESTNTNTVGDITGAADDDSLRVETELAKAIFAIGLRNSSPKVLMTLMKATDKLNACDCCRKGLQSKSNHVCALAGLSTEHIKSHLQKYRMHFGRSSEEVEKIYHQHIRPSFVDLCKAKDWGTLAPMPTKQEQEQEQKQDERAAGQAMASQHLHRPAWPSPGAPPRASHPTSTSEALRVREAMAELDQRTEHGTMAEWQRSYALQQSLLHQQLHLQVAMQQVALAHSRTQASVLRGMSSVVNAMHTHQQHHGVVDERAPARAVPQGDSDKHADPASSTASSDHGEGD